MASALKSIREHCILCMNGKAQKQNIEYVENCGYETCPLWPYRMGRRPDTMQHRPLKSCRTYCVEECQGGIPGEVSECGGNEWVLGACPLYPFRMGKSPNLSVQTREQRRNRVLLQNGIGKQQAAQQAS